MTTTREVLSEDSLYIKIKPTVTADGSWLGDVAITLVCPDKLPLNEDDTDTLFNVGALMAASLLLYEEDEALKEKAQALMDSSDPDDEYLFGDNSVPTVITSSTDNIIRVSFGDKR